jgi:hypothetical protein|tara:strand:- start:185 stop:1321 length:1137 start_codon:yes stop_codon:yes gene_type:complete
MSEIRVDTISEKTSGSGTTISKFKNPKNQFRNMIVNGEMQVRQRSDTSVHNNGQVKPCDMWKQEASNMDNITGTLAIDSSVPDGYGFSGSLRFDTTTAESALASDENVKLITDIEAQNAHHLCYGHSDAKKTVLSWWSKSNLSGSGNKFVINVSAPDGSRHISKTFFHASANTWENFTFTIDGDSSGTINDDNGVGLTLTWVLAAGSDFTSADSTSWGSTSNAGLAYQQTANIASSTSNDFYITGVQFEVGEVATDFEHLPFDVQLQRCQRYFTKYGGDNAFSAFGSGMWKTTTIASVILSYPTEMRSAPTLAVANAGNSHVRAAATAPNATAVAIDVSSPKAIMYNVTVSSGGTGGQGTVHFGDSTTDFTFSLSSEL